LCVKCHVCMHIFIYICMDVFMYLHIHIYVWNMYIRYVCMFVCEMSFVHAYM